MYHTHTPLACSRKHNNAAYEASLSLNPDKTGGSAHHQTAIDKSCSFCTHTQLSKMTLQASHNTMRMHKARKSTQVPKHRATHPWH